METLLRLLVVAQHLDDFAFKKTDGFIFEGLHYYFDSNVCNSTRIGDERGCEMSLDLFQSSKKVNFTEDRRPESVFWLCKKFSFCSTDDCHPIIDLALLYLIPFFIILAIIYFSALFAADGENE